MNRRSFGATVGGLMASWFITPAKRRVDLSKFCHDEVTRFDMTRPFHQLDWTFATDGRVCLRVRPASGDRRDDGEVRLPPALRLPWLHDETRGWRSLSAFKPCDPQKCVECSGSGHIRAVGVRCLKCHGTTEDTWCCWCPQETCGVCNGSGTGVMSFTDGRSRIDVRQRARLLTLGEVDYATHEWANGLRRDPFDQTILMIRYDGGDGLQMPLKPPVQ